MTFTEFLVKRRIDEAAFATGDAGRYAQWQTLYAQMHPNSFCNSIKMVLNDVRRRFHLAQLPAAEVVAASAKPKPVIRRAPSAQATENTAEKASVSRQPAEIVAQQSSLVIEEKKTEETPSEVSAKPAKARPVFKRPASPAENTQVPASEEKSESPAETPAPAPRPRPVFKRPAATTTASDQSIEGKTPEPKAESPTTDTPKPPRPRPVFKRPSAEPEVKSDEAITQKPFSGQNPGNSPKMEETPQAGNAPEETPLPKTPRPRPIFKRPNPSANEGRNPND